MNRFQHQLRMWHPYLTSKNKCLSDATESIVGGENNYKSHKTAFKILRMICKIWQGTVGKCMLKTTTDFKKLKYIFVNNLTDKM